MFTDVLVHDVIVKFERVLECHVIVNFTSLGLNDVSFVGASDIGQLVILSRMDLAAQKFLVSKSSVFLLDQSLGWGGVLFDIRRIEFTHNFVKFVHTDVIVALTFFEAASLIRLLQKDLLEFSINLLCLFFKLLVAPFVRGL